MIAVAFALVVGASAWLGVRGWQARSALTAAVPKVEQLQDQILAGDRTSADATLASLQTQTQRARARTSDPVWAFASLLPWAGANLAAVADVARGVDDLADNVMPPVVASAGTLDLAAMRPVAGRIDLAPLLAAAPLMTTASNAADNVEATVGAIDTGNLFGFVATPVIDVQRRVGELALTLRTGERATKVLPPMLGNEGPRRYLLLLQTNAELRASGGLPGMICVLTADKGSIAMTEQVAASSMTVYPEPVLPLAAEDESLYSDRLGRFMGDVNFTPDFPTTAALSVEMWRRRTGENVDGVIATDPVTLSYVLAATGPVDDGMGGRLTSEDAVDVLLSQAYSRYPDLTDQDAFFASVAASVFAAVSAGQGAPTATASALAKAAGEHRLLVWPARASERAELNGTVLTGDIPDSVSAASSPGATSTVGVFFNDGTGSKMDYYLDTEVSLVSSECVDGVASQTVRVSLRNGSPVDGATSLPDAVTGPGTFGVPKGSIGTNVVVVGALAGRIEGIRRDGLAVGVAADTQDGRPAATVTVELAPSESTILEFRLTDPNLSSRLDLWSTPTKDKSGLTQVTLQAGAQC